MNETIKLNPLGTTPREQWTNSVRIYAMVIRENALDLRECRERDAILKASDSFEREMLRFVDAMFDSIEKEEA